MLYRVVHKTIPNLTAISHTCWNNNLVIKQILLGISCEKLKDIAFIPFEIGTCIYSKGDATAMFAIGEILLTVESPIGHAGFYLLTLI